jgi:hypothetical protein
MDAKELDKFLREKYAYRSQEDIVLIMEGFKTGMIYCSDHHNEQVTKMPSVVYKAWIETDYGQIAVLGHYEDRDEAEDAIKPFNNNGTSSPKGVDEILISKSHLEQPKSVKDCDHLDPTQGRNHCCTDKVKSNKCIGVDCGEFNNTNQK